MEAGARKGEVPWKETGSGRLQGLLEKVESSGFIKELGQESLIIRIETLFVYSVFCHLVCGPCSQFCRPPTVADSNTTLADQPDVHRLTHRGGSITSMAGESCFVRPVTRYHRDAYETKPVFLWQTASQNATISPRVLILSLSSIVAATCPHASRPRPNMLHRGLAKVLIGLGEGAVGYGLPHLLGLVVRNLLFPLLFSGVVYRRMENMLEKQRTRKS